MRRRVLLAAPLAFAACSRRRRPLPTADTPHYVLGGPYLAGGLWRYPAARAEGAETGIAGVLPRAMGTTVTGERYDPDLLTAAHPTLQLPSAVQVTVMRTGRSVVVRVNDRGPEDPARAIAVSPRAAALLGFVDAAAVRMTILPAETAALGDSAGGPTLTLAAAPRGAVTSRPLDGSAAASTTGGAADARAAPSVSLPIGVRTQAPEAVTLGIALGRFTHETAARAQLARAGEAGRIMVARIGRGGEFAVRLGPYDSIGDADAALRRALRAGVLDARIVAEEGS